MTGVIEHCDARGYGALGCKGSWSVLMTVVMEHYDVSGHEAI